MKWKMMRTSDTNTIRPADQTPRLLLAEVLNLSRKVVGGDRFENLYNAVASTIAELNEADLFLLDYGCGAMNFSVRLSSEGRVSRFIGMDIFPKPNNAGTDDDRWENYRQISKSGIGEVSERFDLAIAIDVLHHAREEDQARILRSLAQVSKYVLVKDHFEYSLISRHLLRLADWYGNYAFGVSIPKRYYDRKRWSALVESAGLKELRIKTDVRVHEGLFGLIIRPRHHFISVLQDGALAISPPTVSTQLQVHAG